MNEIKAFARDFGAKVIAECERFAEWYFTLSQNCRDIVIQAAWDSAGIHGMERFLVACLGEGYTLPQASSDWYESVGTIAAEWLVESGND